MRRAFSLDCALTLHLRGGEYIELLNDRKAESFADNLSERAILIIRKRQIRAADFNNRNAWTKLSPNLKKPDGYQTEMSAQSKKFGQTASAETKKKRVGF